MQRQFFNTPPQLTSDPKQSDTPPQLTSDPKQSAPSTVVAPSSSKAWQGDYKGQKFTFLEHKIPPSGNCSLDAMGLDRDSVSYQLMLSIKHVEIRRLIAPEMTAALMEETLDPILSKTLGLLQECQRLRKAYTSFDEQNRDLLNRGKIQLKLPDVEAKTVTNLQELLTRLQKQPDNTLFADEIKTALSRQEKFQQDLKYFCEDQNVQATFIERFVREDKAWLTYLPQATSTLDAIAEIYSLHLLIYTEEKTTGTLTLSHEFKPTAVPARRPAVLFFTGVNGVRNVHFDRLNIAPKDEARFAATLGLPEIRLSNSEKEVPNSPVHNLIKEINAAITIYNLIDPLHKRSEELLQKSINFSRLIGRLGRCALEKPNNKADLSLATETLTSVFENHMRLGISERSNDPQSIQNQIYEAALLGLIQIHGINLSTKSMFKYFDEYVEHFKDHSPLSSILQGVADYWRKSIDTPTRYAGIMTSPAPLSFWTKIVCMIGAPSLILTFKNEFNLLRDLSLHDLSRLSEINCARMIIFAKLREWNNAAELLLNCTDAQRERCEVQEIIETIFPTRTVVPRTSTAPAPAKALQSAINTIDDLMNAVTESDLAPEVVRGHIDRLARLDPSIRDDDRVTMLLENLPSTTEDAKMTPRI